MAVDPVPASAISNGEARSRKRKKEEILTSKQGGAQEQPCPCPRLRPRKSKAFPFIKKSPADGGHCHEKTLTSMQGDRPRPRSRPRKSKTVPYTKKTLMDGHHKAETISSKQGGALEQSCPRRRMNAAKLRWRNLARSIMNGRNATCLPVSGGEALVELQNVAGNSGFCNGSESHKRNSSSVNLQTRCNKDSQSHITQQRKKLTVEPSTLNKKEARRKSLVSKMQQRLRRQQAGILKRMTTWLTEAKFSQIANEQNSNVSGEVFIMTEDERQAFAQNMVKCCQKNKNTRTLFLESVKMLAESGLMHSAASNLLQEGPCEEAQNVMKAWEDFKKQNTTTKGLPMNLLNAVNQLHEKRGDLSNKLSSAEDLGICALSQIDGKSWKFQLPRFPLEEKAKLDGDGNT